MVNVPSPQNIPSSRSWDINFYPKRALMVDAVSTIFNEGSVARFTHYNFTGYQGYNRLFFDGSANWMRDPNCAWRSYMPGNNTSYGNTYQNAWVVADTFGL